MADQLLSTGLEIDDLETRLSRVQGELRTAVSAILDFSTDQPTGQLVSILNEHEQAVAELLQELHSAIDPDQATGQSLDALCSMTGTYRQAATNGTVELTLSLGAAITVPAGSIAAVSGDPDNQWVTTAAVTSIGIGDYTVDATASEAGAIAAAHSTITVIMTPIVGWISVTNVSDATAGSEIETDVELRLRREIEVTLAGSASVDSVQAAVSAVDGVEEVYVYENALPVSATPMPPHCIQVVVWTLLTGAAGAALFTALAEIIFREKAGGIRTYSHWGGAGSVTVTDDQGNEHIIGLDLADEQVLDCEVDIETGDGFGSTAEVETAIAAWVTANIGIGDNVYGSKISGAVISMAGVTNVVEVRLADHGGALIVQDMPMGLREIATMVTGNITVAVV